MEWTWVPNITEVKMRKRRASKHRKMRRMTVAGGEKVLHSRGEGWGGGGVDEEDKRGRAKKRGFMNKSCFTTSDTKLCRNLLRHNSEDSRC